MQYLIHHQNFSFYGFYCSGVSNKKWVDQITINTSFFRPNPGGAKASLSGNVLFPCIVEKSLVQFYPENQTCFLNFSLFNPVCSMKNLVINCLCTQCHALLQSIFFLPVVLCSINNLDNCSNSTLNFTSYYVVIVTRICFAKGQFVSFY